MSITKCKNCGADVPTNMKFCGTCGTLTEHIAEQPVVSDGGDTSATVPAAGTSFLNPEKLKKFIVPALVIAVVIIIVSIFQNILKPPKYQQSDFSLSVYQNDDKVVVEINGKTKSTIDGRLYDDCYSLDRKTAAVLVNEDGDNAYGDDFDGYSLYVITDKATLITDGVFSMQMSVSGDGIVFLSDMDYMSNTAELCLWTGGKVTTVTPDCYTSYNPAISPDGKTVSYVVYDEDERVLEGMYYNGKSTSLGKDMIPVVVTNGAKYVYYNKNNSFYVQKGDDSDTKNKLGEGVYRCYFNKDMTQITYNYNGKSYISRNGGEKASLSGMISNFLMPYGTAFKYTDNNYVYIHGISSFADTFYVSDSSSVIGLNKKFEANSVVRDAYEPQLARDGKTIFYRRSDSVRKVDGTKENAENKELVKEDVQNFIATRDGKAIYFVNDDSELYYQKGTGKPVRVSEDVERYNSFWAMYGNNKLFYVSDGELFWSTGAKGKTVTGIDGNVNYVYNLYDVIYANSSDSFDTYTYRSADGSKFEQYE